jgi:hypothetical protein
MNPLSYRKKWQPSCTPSKKNGYQKTKTDRKTIHHRATWNLIQNKKKHEEYGRIDDAQALNKSSKQTTRKDIEHRQLERVQGTLDERDMDRTENDDTVTRPEIRRQSSRRRHPGPTRPANPTGRRTTRPPTHPRHLLRKIRAHTQRSPH